MSLALLGVFFSAISTADSTAANAARTRDISVGLMALAETDCQS